MLESPKDVIPGQLYDVPCVEYELNQPFGIQPIPIILPGHADDNDTCLNKLANHYHLDFRFIDRNFWLKASGATDTDTNAILDPYNDKTPYYAHLRALKTRAISAKAFLWFVNRWQNRYPNQKIKDGICPHQGTKITNPCGTCPAHGLAWNLETGEYKYKTPFFLQLMPDGPLVELPDTDKILKFQFEVNIPKGFIWNKNFCLVDSLGQKYADLEEPCTYTNYKETDVKLSVTFDLSKTCVKI